MTGPTHRIRVIEGSCKCFAWGLTALVPGLGLPAAVVAIHEYIRTRNEAGGHWNPARRYLLLGCLLAWAGVGFTVALTGLGAALMARYLDLSGFKSGHAANSGSAPRALPAGAIGAGKFSSDCFSA